MQSFRIDAASLFLKTHEGLAMAACFCCVFQREKRLHCSFKRLFSCLLFLSSQGYFHLKMIVFRNKTYREVSLGELGIPDW